MIGMSPSLLRKDNDRRGVEPITTDTYLLLSSISSSVRSRCANILILIGGLPLIDDHVAQADGRGVLSWR